jgi:hypothetical protein
MSLASNLLSAHVVGKFLENLNSSSNSSAAPLPTLDLAREFRGKSFRVVHLLLQNPILELLSAGPPNVPGTACNHKHRFFLMKHKKKTRKRKSAHLFDPVFFFAITLSHECYNGRCRAMDYLEQQNVFSR